jgi:hypothetical protein
MDDMTSTGQVGIMCCYMDILLRVDQLTHGDRVSTNLGADG